MRARRGLEENVERSRAPLRFETDLGQVLRGRGSCKDALWKLTASARVASSSIPREDRDMALTLKIEKLEERIAPGTLGGCGGPDWQSGHGGNHGSGSCGDDSGHGRGHSNARGSHSDDRGHSRNQSDDRGRNHSDDRGKNHSDRGRNESDDRGKNWGKSSSSSHSGGSRRHSSSHSS